MGLVVGTNCGFVTEAPTSDPDGSIFYVNWRCSALKDTSPATALKITEIGWYASTATADTNFEVGIYDDNDGAPGDLIHVERTNAKGAGTGWKSVTVDWNISSNTIYWLAYQVDNVESTGSDYTSSSGIYYYDRFELTLKDTWVLDSSSNDLIALYAVWEAGEPSTNFTQTDQLTLSDEVTVTQTHIPQTYSFTQTDSISLTDEFTSEVEGVAQHYSKTFTDSITLIDSLSVTHTHTPQEYSFTQTDQITLSDEFTSEIMYAGQLDPKATYNIKTKIEIDGTEYSDYVNMKVKKSMSDYNSSSSFSITMDSPYGRHKSSFSVGDEVVIYAEDTNETPTSKLLTGVLEKIRFSGIGTSQMVTLSGRDFSVRLMDTTVEPSVYTDSEVSTIVTNIIQNFVSNITINNVNVTTTTLERINFRHTSVFDAISELAELSSFTWYVDTDKDLHFEEKESISSGYLLDENCIISTNYEQTREGMSNDVWVYGDKYLSSFQEILNFGSPVGGSVITVLNKPHNTYVEYLGSPFVGGVSELVTDTISGVDYVVDYYDRQLIFVSGTDMGYSSIPGSGGSVMCKYDREIPIVRHKRDIDSIINYGRKTKVIQDSSIKDPRTAEAVATNEITKSDPLNGLEIDLRGWLDLTPGNTINIELDNFNIDKTVGIISIDYTFDANRIRSNRIMKIKVDKKILDLTDEIKNLSKKIHKLESSNLVEEQTITRYEEHIGSLNVIGSYWEVNQRTIGSSFILSHLVNGILGSPAVSICGSQVALGDSRSAFSTIASGGGT